MVSCICLLDFLPFDADDLGVSSPRRPSLVDTDKTIVADENNTDTINTPVDQEQCEEQNDTDGTRITTLFRQESVSLKISKKCFVESVTRSCSDSSGSNRKDLGR